MKNKNENMNVNSYGCQTYRVCQNYVTTPIAHF